MSTNSLNRHHHRAGGRAVHRHRARVRRAGGGGLPRPPDPELVRQWLGPNGYEMDIERWDFTTGGGYRYLHANDKGRSSRFNGVFHVVRENEFAIQTFEFEGVPTWSPSSS